MANRLLKGLSSSSRHVAARYNIPKHLPMFRDLKLLENDDDKSNNQLLLRRFFGLTENGTYYFSSLSTDEGQCFSPKHNIYPPFPMTLPYPVDIVGSCDGLLCLEDRNLAGKVVLWSPSTDGFKFLPPSSVQPPPGTASVKFSRTGFGFDYKSDDYKVIRFIENCFEDEEGHLDYIVPYVELYSFKSDSWKGISHPKMSPRSSPSAYVDGVYYWIAIGDTGGSSILSFNFFSEEFDLLPFPDSGKKRLGPYNLCLFEFDGSLCAIVYPIFGIEKSFDIWVLNCDDKSWSKICDFRIAGAEIPLGFWKKNALFFEGTNRELLVLDLATRELKNLGIYESPLTMKLIPYVASTVVPLIGRSEKEAETKRMRGGAIQQQRGSGFSC